MKELIDATTDAPTQACVSLATSALIFKLTFLDAVRKSSLSYTPISVSAHVVHIYTGTQSVVLASCIVIPENLRT
eukprot:SAG31_NODE_399_length_16247_cov_19.137540_8_plen_75_part_00